ncbi:MAG: hypothetical protein SF187_00075 [Deltaproteobacteria bacterium]|nr:hypothetical protein [Deltaproteobacteria bacterium]
MKTIYVSCMMGALWLIAACVPTDPQNGNGLDGGNTADAEVKLDVAPKTTLVPVTRPALDNFLLEQRYLDFAGESGLHQSEGPHFGRVRTFMNPILVASLQAGNMEHPQGAAAVKELYKGGQTLLGWAVMVKIGPRSGAGDGWYFFEADGNRAFADGTAEPVCAQCHESGNDFILSAFPLR